MRLIEQTLLLLLLLLLLLFPASSCLQKFVPLPSPRQEAEGTVAVVEEKMRLGSTPPNCNNHCNRCKPCTPVQVPPLPTTRPDRTGRFPTRVTDYDRYSNYKPLGWKCRCNEHLYDP